MEEILDELEDRYNRKNYRNAKKTNKEIIDEFIKRMKIECDDENILDFQIFSILDKMKLDLLINNFEKISLNDLENLIK